VIARHLSAAELLDLAEGAADERSYPHLASCDDCRGELADARAAIALARSVDAPEPSPLFWDHLSARIHDAVAADRSSSSAQRTPWVPWRLAVPLGAAMIVAVALGVLPRTSRNTPVDPAPQAPIDASTTAPDVPIADDASLSFVADLASDLDWDAAAQAGFTARPGDVEDVLPTLSATETAELQRLLTEALAQRPTRDGV
jgi:hypothetical protein